MSYKDDHDFYYGSGPRRRIVVPPTPPPLSPKDPEDYPARVNIKYATH